MSSNEDLFFEARELQRGAVYVADSELVEGTTYFQVYCLDEDGYIPQLDALVYIGRDRLAGDIGRLYFQDAASYLAGARYDAPTKDAEAELHVVDRGTPFVHEFEDALDTLLRCSLRRRRGGL